MDNMLFIVNIIIGVILIYLGYKFLKTNKGLGYVTMAIGVVAIVARVFDLFNKMR